MCRTSGPPGAAKSTIRMERELFIVAFLCGSIVLPNADDQLAEVFAFQQMDERQRSIFESFYDIFAVLDLAFGYPGAHVFEEFAEMGGIVVVDYESPHFDAARK